MAWYLVKVLLSAVLIVLISEVSKRAAVARQPDCIPAPYFRAWDDLDVWGKNRCRKDCLAFRGHLLVPPFRPCRCSWSCLGHRAMGRILSHRHGYWDRLTGVLFMTRILAKFGMNL